MAPLMARTVHDDPRLVRSGLAEGSLTCGYAVERVTRIELALSAWELYGAASPPPADWMTCGCADVLSVSDPDCPRWLLRSGTQRAREHLIRRSGHTVQDRLVWSVCWADIPQLSRCVGCCPPAWLQSWLQSRGSGADPRPLAFQAGHIPSSRGSCGSYALSSVAAVSWWLLPLLSPLLSAAVRYAPYSR